MAEGNTAIEALAPGGSVADSVVARGPSERRILEGALRAVARRGTRRLAMSDVCHEAGVSRATIYRYFKTMDELLKEVADFVLVSSEEGLLAATAAQSDPLEKLRAALRFGAVFNSSHPTTGMLEIDPLFVVEFLTTHFPRHVAGMRRAITPACEMIGERTGAAPDPTVLANFFVRANLSTMLVPGDQTWMQIADAAVDFIRANISGSDPSKAAA